MGQIKNDKYSQNSIDYILLILKLILILIEY